MKSIKEYIISEVWNNKYEKHDYNWVNDEEGGRHCYLLKIWSGKGYLLTPFIIFADDEETALERAIAYCEKNNFDDLLQDDDVDNYKKELEEEGLSQEEIEDKIDQTYLYVDPTMEGGKEVHFIYLENLRMVELTKDQLNEIRNMKESRISKPAAGRKMVTESKWAMNDNYGQYDEYSAAELFEETLADREIIVRGFKFWSENDVAICLYGDWKNTHKYAADLMARKGWLMISQQEIQNNPDVADDCFLSVQRYTSTMYCADSYEELKRRYPLSFKKRTEQFKKKPHTREIKRMIMNAKIK